MSSPRIVKKTISREVKKRVLNIDPEMESLYREAFDLFDKEKIGTIGPDQIRRALKKFGQEITKDEVVEMISHMEHDGKYNINFEQFITLMTTGKETEHIEVLEEDEIVKAFRRFDYDKDGKVTGAEFKYILTKIGDGLSQREADNILKIANVKENSYIDYVDLVDFWRAHIRRGK